MYVFTRLNKVYDAIPATKSHSNKLFPRPPTPFDGRNYTCLLVCVVNEGKCSKVVLNLIIINSSRKQEFFGLIQLLYCSRSFPLPLINMATPIKKAGWVLCMSTVCYTQYTGFLYYYTS